MTAVVHVTDPHFEFMPVERVVEFGRHVREVARDAGAHNLFITGDVATAATLYDRMVAFHDGLGDGLSVVACRGNHDLYGTSFAAQKRLLHGWHVDREEDMTEESLGQTSGPLMCFNAACGTMGDGLAFVCVDGWYDLRAGKGERTSIVMSDWHAILDFAGLTRAKIVEACRLLADESAREVVRRLEFMELTSSVRDEMRAERGEPLTVGERRRVIVATHVPPFVEAALHEGQRSDPDWAPVMTNIALGDALYAFAAEHPDVEVTVLCGHTHSPADVRIAANLRVVAGRARYGEAFGRVVEV